MLLTVTATPSASMPEPTDLGYLLAKHPDKAQTFEVTGGTAHVFYPEATAQRCSAALLFEVDPVALVRGTVAGGFALGQYVNDRPYAASSLFAAAVGKVFRSALNGICTARPDLLDAALPLELTLPCVPAPRGIKQVCGLFSALGWQAIATPMPCDPQLPQWGDAPFVSLHLRGTFTMSQALSHVYVLLPALAGSKHYWVSSAEVDKLVRVGGQWLANHPEREWISHRYLARKREFVTATLERLATLDDADSSSLPAPLTAEDPANIDAAQDSSPQRPLPLAVLRRIAVLDVLRDLGAAHVVDLGCGEGALLRELLHDSRFTRVIGADVSASALDAAERRLNLDRMGDRQRDRLQLVQSSAMYRDDRLAGADAMVLMEVVEHVDLPRLSTLERNVFGAARPQAVVVTTPNSDYNVRYESLADGELRHRDHRFEWTRAQFAAWAEQVAARYGYTVRLLPIGAVDEQVGAPTQMAVFTREGAA